MLGEEAIIGGGEAAPCSYESLNITLRTITALQNGLQMGQIGREIDSSPRGQYSFFSCLRGYKRARPNRLLSPHPHPPKKPRLLLPRTAAEHGAFFTDDLLVISDTIFVLNH